MDPQDICITIKKMDNVMFWILDNKEGVPGDATKLLLSKDMETYANRRQLYYHNKATMHSIVLWNFIDETKNQL